jgi:hypothetical protein
MHRGNSETGSKPVSVRAQAPSAHIYIPCTDERWANRREGMESKRMNGVEVVSYVYHAIEAT